MKFLASSLIFLAVSVTVAVALAFAGHGIHPATAICSLAAGIIAAGFTWRQTRSSEKQAPMTIWDWAIGAIFILAALRAFIWLIYSDGEEVKILSPNNLGDISLHLQFIQFLAAGAPFWPESPILSGVPLTYPLGADLFNALLTVCGADVFRGLVWVGLFGSALTLIALRRWGGAFAVAAFLFNGGLAGFVFFQSFKLLDFQGEMEWKNFFLTMFVTQRGLLYAVPAGLSLMDNWRREYFHGQRWLPTWASFVLYASMPLFNVHAFLFLSFILLAIFIAKREARLKLIRFVAAAFLPATIAMLLVTGFFGTKSGLHVLPGWLQKGNPFYFWIMNFGISLPLAIAVCVMLIRDRDKEARAFVWMASGIFLLCCFVSFAVWPWDNMKLMMWSWLVVAPFLWKKILLPLPVWPRAALCFLLFFTGAISLTAGLDGRHGYGLAKRKELADAARLIRLIPPEARLACAPTFNNPVILLGRPVVCGYDGHLWSHGLNYDAKMLGLMRIFAAIPGWENDARSLNASYLYVREGETIASAYTAGLYDLRFSPPRKIGVDEALPVP